MHHGRAPLVPAADDGGLALACSTLTSLAIPYRLLGRLGGIGRRRPLGDEEGGRDGEGDG
ncbi:hypothetical protein GCM10009555_045700 [Acrocarpospora macrocephala]|uniref:Uncharacterized protein n=2 Tax=Acrocarpospora macrocephala TaxID=150177 RepID=A0A5M3WCI5_9ACTN|nr:hypothetical protein Amac_003620 [Acrocarpospora macrocephala]